MKKLILAFSAFYIFGSAHAEARLISVAKCVPAPGKLADTFPIFTNDSGLEAALSLGSTEIFELSPISAFYHLKLFYDVSHKLS